MRSVFRVGTTSVPTLTVMAALVTLAAVACGSGPSNEESEATRFASTPDKTRAATGSSASATTTAATPAPAPSAGTEAAQSTPTPSSLTDVTIPAPPIQPSTAPQTAPIVSAIDLGPLPLPGGVPGTIVVMDADGAVVVLSRDQPARLLVPASPDEPLHPGSAAIDVDPTGSHVYFSQGGARVLRISMSGGPVEEVAIGESPTLSPDGTRLAYLAAGERANACIRSAVTVRVLATGSERTWHVPPRAVGQFDRCPGRPAWSADGTRIGYALGWENILNNVTYVLDPTLSGELLGQPDQRIDAAAGHAWRRIGSAGPTGELTAIDVVPEPGGDPYVEPSPRLIAIYASGAELETILESAADITSYVFDSTGDALIFGEYQPDGAVRLQLRYDGTTTTIASGSLIAFDWSPG